LALYGAVATVYALPQRGRNQTLGFTSERRTQPRGVHAPRAVNIAATSLLGTVKTLSDASPFRGALPLGLRLALCDAYASRQAALGKYMPYQTKETLLRVTLSLTNIA